MLPLFGAVRKINVMKVQLPDCSLYCGKKAVKKQYDLYLLPMLKDVYYTVESVKLLLLFYPCVYFRAPSGFREAYPTVEQSDYSAKIHWVGSAIDEAIYRVFKVV